MNNTVVIDGELSLNITENVEGVVGIVNDGDLGVVVETGRFPVYDGETVITPSNETQVLSTDKHTLRSDITINPIPQNYGLITWNGSVITVS